MDDLNRHAALAKKLRQIQAVRSDLLGDGFRRTGKAVDVKRDTTAAVAAERLDLESAENTVRQELAEMEPELTAFLAGVDDILLRAAVSCRYGEGCSWAETAKRLHTTPASLRMSFKRWWTKRERSDG